MVFTPHVIVISSMYLDLKMLSDFQEFCLQKNSLCEWKNTFGVQPLEYKLNEHLGCTHRNSLYISFMFFSLISC